jgi:hypothetical protein
MTGERSLKLAGLHPKSVTVIQIHDFVAIFDDLRGQSSMGLVHHLARQHNGPPEVSFPLLRFNSKLAYLSQDGDSMC